MGHGEGRAAKAGPRLLIDYTVSAMPARNATETTDGRLLLQGVILIPRTMPGIDLVPGTVEVRDGRIHAVRLGDAAGDDTRGAGSEASGILGGPHSIICPGFCDAHLHLPQFDSIGREGLELLTWLDRVVFPAEARWIDADYAGAMAERVARQLLAHGTTTIAAYSSSHAAATRVAIEALGRAGMQGVVGLTLMDRAGPAELCRPGSELLRDAEELGVWAGGRRMNAGWRVGHAVTPRFAISCTPALLAGAGELAARQSAIVQTHLAETIEECREVEALFSGARYTEVYEGAGLLTARTILGHGIHLNDDDRALLSARGATIAHCPTANDFLHAGLMDLAAHRGAGLSVALGSDVAGGPDRSMVRVARGALDTARRLGRPSPGAAWAWWQITRGNCAAMGLEGAGTLSPGSDADVLVITPDIGWQAVLHRDGVEAALAMLLYAWDDRWLDATVVGGRIATRPAR